MGLYCHPSRHQKQMGRLQQPVSLAIQNVYRLSICSREFQCFSAVLEPFVIQFVPC